VTVRPRRLDYSVEHMLGRAIPLNEAGERIACTSVTDGVAARPNGDAITERASGTAPYTRIVVERKRELTEASEARFWSGVADAEKFFMGEADVQRALLKLARLLDQARIPYAVLGAMALNEYGYRRVTIDIDVLLTAEGLEAFRTLALGRGYVEQFPGSRGLRDPEHGVPIDVVVSGEYPGDGRPKPVRFPDPETVGVRGARVTLVPLSVLVELKIASGMSAPHRLRDLADVLELIRTSHLPVEFAEQLDPSVRQKYRELWEAAQAAEPE
jgi:hypothetical protein